MVLTLIWIGQFVWLFYAISVHSEQFVALPVTMFCAKFRAEIFSIKEVFKSGLISMVSANKQQIRGTSSHIYK